MMYSAYKLNKQSDNILPWCIPFPIWNQPVVLCPVLLHPDLHTDFSRGRWGGLVLHLFQNFPQFIVIHIVKGFEIVNKAEIDGFQELSCFFIIRQMLVIWYLVSVFSKTSLNIWKFTVHISLKLGLEDFEHYFSRVWDECNCVVVWTFFHIAILWDWNENWPFPVLWPLLSFPNILTYWVQHFQFSSVV